MFETAKTVTRPNHSTLMVGRGEGDKAGLELERVPGQLILESRTVSLVSRVDFETTIYSADKQRSSDRILASHEFLSEKDADNPSFEIKSSKPATTISLQAPPYNTELFCFKGDQFLGRVTRFHVEIGSSDATGAHVRVNKYYDRSGETDEFALYGSVLLKHDEFSHLFRHLWLASSDQSVRVTLVVPCFQWGPEGAFGEPQDTNHYVIEADRGLSASLTAVRVTRKFETFEPADLEPTSEFDEPAPRQDPTHELAQSVSRLETAAAKWSASLKQMQIAIFVLVAVVLLGRLF